MAGEKPTGTVTFLFTDVEGSTGRWESEPSAMREAVARHDALARKAFEAYDGYVFATGGDGFAVAFPRAGDAVDAARMLQQSLAAETWPTAEPIRVRIGINTGEAEERDGDYFGPAVNRAARIEAAGHGGQVLCSDATAALADVETTPLGRHRLRGVPEPVVIHQVRGDGMELQFPALRTTAAAASTLPTSSGALVGRDADVAAVVTAVAAHRIVTLTGAGGSGKTRLAIESARAAAGEFPDGVFFVDLSPVSDDEQFLPAIASGLGLAAQDGDLRLRITDVLADRHALVVLDNCEHVLDLVAAEVEHLVDAALGVRFVTTSREPIELDGEHVSRVDGLDPGAAVDLFVERAQRDVGPDELGAIAEIVERLDRLPLAIELAAARAALLSPTEIRDRLDDRFRLLTGGRRRTRGRQATLEAAIDWSYDLLDEPERYALQALSVMPASFDLAMAAAVMDVDELDALDLMEGLVARSLLTVQDAAAATSTRYRLLETIREYAHAKRLASAEPDAPPRRHARHVVDRLSKVVDVQVTEFLELAPDIVVAHDFAGTKDPDLARQTAVPVVGLLLSNYHHQDVLELADELLAGDLPPEAEAAVANYAGLAASRARTGTAADYRARAIRVGAGTGSYSARFLQAIQDAFGSPHDVGEVVDQLRRTAPPPDAPAATVRWYGMSAPMLATVAAWVAGDFDAAVAHAEDALAAPGDQDWNFYDVWAFEGLVLADVLAGRPEACLERVPASGVLDVVEPAVLASRTGVMVAADAALAVALARASGQDRDGALRELERLLDWLHRRVDFPEEGWGTFAVGLAGIHHHVGDRDVRDRLLRHASDCGDVAWGPYAFHLAAEARGIPLARRNPAVMAAGAQHPLSDLTVVRERVLDGFGALGLDGR